MADFPQVMYSPSWKYPQAEPRDITGQAGHRKYVRNSFLNAATDNFTSPPSQNPDTFATLENVIVGINNTITRRWGSTIFANPTITSDRIYEAHFINGRNRFLLVAADGTGTESSRNKVVAVNENGSLVTSPHSIIVPAAGAKPPQVVLSRNYAYFADGIAADMKKWDSDDDPTASTTITVPRLEGDFVWTFPSVSKWGIDPPTTAIVPSNEGDGNVEVEGLGRAYTYFYRNNLTGHCSDIAPFSIRFGTNPDGSTVGDILIGLTNITASTDPQVSEIVVVATAENGGQSTLYEVIVLSNGEIPTTGTMTFDNNREGDLVNREVWSELDADGNEVGVIGNSTPPSAAPTATIACVHRGRIYLLQGHFLFWSKSLGELTTSTGITAGVWEEAFPVENQLSLSSSGTEIGTAMMSDEVNLYIGTNRSVYFLSGDTPGLVPPRALFHEVGVLNNQVWKPVYHEGHQVGAIWMTPEHRMIWSDFNTYRNIGQPIQNTLTAYASTIVTTANATFIADGPFEFYIFTPNDDSGEFLVYNVRTDAWMEWLSLYDPVRVVSYMYDSVNIRTLPIFDAGANRLYRWDKSLIHDRDSEGGKLPPSVVKTNWLDLGDPFQTKMLNDIEIMTDDLGIGVTIEGAISQQDFDAPVTIAAGLPFVASPFTTLKTYLYTKQTPYRFFRLLFEGFDDESATIFLSYLSLDYSPVHYS